MKNNQFGYVKEMHKMLKIRQDGYLGGEYIYLGGKGNLGININPQCEVTWIVGQYHFVMDLERGE